MPRIENDIRGETWGRTLRFMLMVLPVDIVGCTVVSWAALASNLSTLLGTSVPWWILGPALGVVLWALAFPLIYSMNRSMAANIAPFALDLESDGISAHLPPIAGSSSGSARQVFVPWKDVDAIRPPGLIAPGMIQYHRDPTPTVPPPGVRPGESWTITRATAQQVEEGRRAWMATVPGPRA